MLYFYDHLHSLGFLFILYTAAATAASHLMVTEKGLGPIAENSAGLQVYVVLNNTSDFDDYEVDFYPERCCLNGNDEANCQIIDACGLSEYIPRGKAKKLTLIAPLINLYNRKGNCTAMIESKSPGETLDMRRVVIDFDTNGKLLVDNNFDKAIHCANVDEDPSNDCELVDCDVYYNGMKSFTNRKRRQCSEVPACVPNQLSDTPNVVYDPISNNCHETTLISDEDLDFLTFMYNSGFTPIEAPTVLPTTGDFDINSINYHDYNDNILPSTKIYRHAVTEASLLRSYLDQLKKVNYTSFASLFRFPKRKKGKVHEDDDECDDDYDDKEVKHRDDDNDDNNEEEENKEGRIDKIKPHRPHKPHKPHKPRNWRRCIIMILVTVVIIQCCIIFSLMSCLKKKGQNTEEEGNYYTQGHVTVTTPLITPSNVDSETTDYKYQSESSNVNQKIQSYKAIQKELNKPYSVKKSLSDDILSKCLNRRNWNQHMLNEEAIAETSFDDAKSKIEEKCVNFIETSAKLKETTEPREQIQQDNERTFTNTGQNPHVSCNRCRFKDDGETSLKQGLYSEEVIKCYDYSNTNVPACLTKSENTAFPSSTNPKTDESISEKATQAYFSNDSIDEYLSGKGLVLLACDASNVSKLSLSGSSMLNSSKTSRMKSVLSSMFRKKVKTGPASEPGTQRSKERLNVELLHMSQNSLFSSSVNDSMREIQTISDSRTSM